MLIKKSPTLTLTLIIMFSWFFSCAILWASSTMQITKVKGDLFIFKVTEGIKIHPGDRINIYDEFDDHAGSAQVTKIREGFAAAKITRGVAISGYQVQVMYREHEDRPDEAESTVAEVDNIEESPSNHSNPRHHVAFKTDLAQDVTKMFNFSFEVAVTKSTTLGLTGGPLNTTVDEVHAKGKKLGVKSDYYFSGVALSDGFFLSTELGYLQSTLSSTITPTNTSAKSISLSEKVQGPYGSAMGGYRWNFDALFLDFGLGMNYYFLDQRVRSHNEPAEMENPFSQAIPRIGLGIGIQF